MNIIKKVNEKKLSEDNVDISVIKSGTGYQMLQNQEISKYL